MDLRYSEQKIRKRGLFNVIDKEKQLLEVDFENTPVASIVYDIGTELEIDMFIASPLENAGSATVKAKNIKTIFFLVDIVITISL